MEIAYISANKVKLNLDIKHDSFNSKILAKLVDKPSHYISTILLGNNIALVVYGIFMAKILLPYITPYITSEFGILLSQTILSTILILIFAEFVPKTLFRTINNRSLKAFAVPLMVFVFLFKPFVNFTIWLSKSLLQKTTKLNFDDDTNDQAFGKIDIIDFIEKSKSCHKQKEENQEFKFIQNALDFSKIKLRECIVPRGDIVTVKYETDIEELTDLFIKTGYSNILVYKTNIDEIIGYVNIKDIFKNPKTISSILRQVIIVPESMPAKYLLEQLIDSNKSLAVVVDEFGGTEGIVTIEDIIEEIFGDIEDEHDNLDVQAKITKEGNLIMSGRHYVDDINEKFKLKLSESDDYETIAGYIFSHHGNFPNEGDEISINDDGKEYRFKVLKVKDTKIEKLLMYRTTNR